MTIIERAFDLAGNGGCRSLSDIAATLKRENYSNVEAHLQGAAIRKSLKGMLSARLDARIEPQPAVAASGPGASPVR